LHHVQGVYQKNKKGIIINQSNNKTIINNQEKKKKNKINHKKNKKKDWFKSQPKLGNNY